MATLSANFNPLSPSSIEAQLWGSDLGIYRERNTEITGLTSEALTKWCLASMDTTIINSLTTLLPHSNITFKPA